RDGVIVLRAALEPTSVQALEASVDKAVADHCVDLSPLSESVAAASFHAGVDHYLEDPVLAAFAIDSPLAHAVASLLDVEHLYLYEDSILVKDPDNAPPTQLHQDIGYFGIEGSNIATSWTSLDTVDEQSGAVQYVVGSHRWNDIARPNLFVSDTPVDGTKGRTISEIMADHPDAEIVSFETEPGDVIVHHARTIHGAYPNCSPRRRRALSVRYCGGDSVICRRAGTEPKSRHASLKEGSTVCEPSFPLAASRSATPDPSTTST
ncbi:MAG: phytanoyl-CoA dioxygenase family protein, partial [Acidobacteria bacterium]|nr:phytanoyl-CoA dioxygenase family protein [Acidobacteriota bacterium]